MKIVTIGTGYVGLVTGACFAENGVSVDCVDVDQTKIDALASGEIPFYEPGLKDLVARAIKNQKIAFKTQLDDALSDAQVAFICVGTPSSPDGSANLEYVFSAAREVAAVAPQGLILVTKSTVPVTTGDQIEAILVSLGRSDIAVVSNPEFLREGSAVQDCLFPDRIVIGTDNAKAAKVLENLYKPFVRTGNPILKMARRSAEMAKYGANALLASRISFINEISRLCEKVDANIEDVRHAMGSDHRIGMQYLFPSVGFGGSCFPKDVRALHFLAASEGMQPHMLSATLECNELQKQNFVQRIYGAFGGEDQLKGKRIAVWGISFKAKTDDIRESPALTVIDQLLASGATVVAHDPEAMENAKQYYEGRIAFAADHYAALEDADALCVLTEWNTYRNPDFTRIKKMMKRALIFDGRNLYQSNLNGDEDIEFYFVGRAKT